MSEQSGTQLPLTPSCNLDADGMQRQRERYRQVGTGAALLERTPRQLVVEVRAESAHVVPELIEVETQCCPFFELSWDADSRRFSVSVSDREHEPALDAIGFALGL